MVFKRKQPVGTPANLLISFCNLGAHASAYSLAVFEGASQQFFFIDTRPFMDTNEDTGITGICYTDDGIACCIQSAKPRVVLLDANLQATKSIDLPMAIDLHSLLWDKDSQKLVVSSARNNQLISIANLKSDAPTIEIAWQSDQPIEKSLHLNCPILLDGTLFFSSHRNPGNVKTDTTAADDEGEARGIIMRCSDSRIVATGLQQPHTLIPHKGGAIIASSFGGDIYFLSKEQLFSDGDPVNLRSATPYIESKDYIRGMAADAQYIYLGGSARRIVSRKQGITKRYVDDPNATLGDPRFFSMLYILDAVTHKTVFQYNLSALGFDIYDILVLDTAPESHYLHAEPAALRAQAYRNIMTTQEIALHELKDGK